MSHLNARAGQPRQKMLDRLYNLTGSVRNQRGGGMHPNDTRSPPYNQVQGVMMASGPRAPYIPGHSIPITQRPMRNRSMYQQSPQGHSPMQGFIPQHNVQYQVVGQDPYSQPMMRHAYIPNVPQYQMQATSAPFQPQFITQQPQFFNQGMPQAMYYMQPNQQIQQPQQQQPTQTQTQNTALQTNNTNKPKQKRSKIVIRDPTKDNKDVTEEILHSNTANGRTGSTPPLTSYTVQTDSSKIQAQFAAQVAARVGGEKGKQINEKKAEDTGKDKDGQASTAQIDETKTEANVQGNGSVVTNESCAKDLPQNNTELPNKVTSIAEENRTGSPKGTTDNTHANQSSPTLGEMTQKMKMTIESQKGTRDGAPKVVLKRADRETTTKSEGSETTTKSEGSETTTKSEGSETTTKSEGSETKEVADVSVPMSQNNENTGERKTSKVVVHSPVEQTKNEDKGDSLDNGQNGINVSKTPESNETLSEMTSDKTKKIVETITDTEGDAKEDIGKETGSKQEVIAQIQEEIVKPNESHGELLSQPEVAKQETTEQQAEKVAEQEQNKLSQVEKQPELIQADKEQQIRQAEKEQEFEVVKQQEQQIDKQQQQQIDKQQQQQQSDKQQEKQSDKQQQQQSDKRQEKQSDKQQQQNDKQQEKQSDKQQQQADKQQQQQTDKQQQQQQTRQPDKKPDNPKPQQQEKQLQQLQKAVEAPKKRSSKQRFKDINKKETGGDLMDAYTDKPPPQEPVVEEKAKPVEVMPEKPPEEDLSWEDKEEKIGEEIKVDNETEPERVGTVEPTTRKYDRDFLLQFQFIPVCTEKPAGLPNIEVVLDSPTSQNKSGGSQRGGSDFLPSYARQKSQGGGGRRDSRGKPQARKIITAAPAPPVVLKQSENRWLRPEEKEKQLSEDEKKTAELYRNVVAILNKLTPQKFKTLMEQIMALSIDTSERLEGVIDRIFEKAIGEPVFSVAYANMCRCLFGIKVADAEGKDVSFRKLLLNRCQKEFEKEKEDEQALLEKFSHLEGLSGEEKKVKKEEMDEALAKNKRRMLGNIKFIGELFKLKLLTENIMHDCIFKLLRAGDEESLESMCKLLFTIGKDLDSDKAKPRIEQYFEQIGKIITAKKISSRVIFMLRDVVELRDNKWVPRREEHYNPKTIDQIHKEAQMEKMQEQRLAAQMPSKDNKQKKGGPGGRDSPKPTSNDGWITTGKGGKSVPIDQNKLRNMAKRANNEEISLGPSSRFGQWGRGSSAGLSNSSQEQEQPQGNRYSALSGGDMPSGRPYDPRKTSSGSRPSSAGSRGSDKSRVKNDKDKDKDRDREAALEAVRNLNKRQQPEKHQVVQPSQPANQEKQEVKETKEPKEPVKELVSEPVKEPLSEDELAKKTTALIDEYANIRDLKEAVACFTDLHSPDLHHLFVLTAVEHTYEMSSTARHDTGVLFVELLSRNKLSKKQLSKGFNSVLELAYDNAIDYPMLWKYLAEIITPVIVKDLFTLSDLKPLILKHLIPVGKAAALFAEILLMTKELKGENRTIQIWKDLGITWSEVLPERLTQEEFLSRKNLNFLPTKNNDELLQLLRAADDELKNDTVFAHIEKHFKEEKRKEAPFICQLVTAVAESCIINKERDGGPDCCQDKLKARKDILRKYLDNNNILELEALFALQKIYVKYNKPADMLSQFFNTLYDEEVITEEAFMTWKRDESPSRQEAKGPALQATTSFFEWLQSATVEGGEN